MSRSRLIACALITFLSCFVGSSHAATVNGLANGGFEFTGSSSPAQSWLAAAEGYSLSTDARTGSFSAQLMSPPFNAAVFFQNSVNDGLMPPLTVGDNPMLSFHSKGFAGTTGNVLFALRYLDKDGIILANSGNQFFHNSINTSTWTEITYSLGVVPAGAESAFIEFSQGIGAINGVDMLAGNVLIDDIRLDVVSSVPEPTSFGVLFLSGLVVLGRRSRK